MTPGSRAGSGADEKRKGVDLTLWLRGESLEQHVEDTLFDMHVERGRVTFTVDEIAEKAGLPVQLTQAILERLRAQGKVSRKHGKRPRYQLKDHYLDKRLEEAGLETYTDRKFRESLELIELKKRAWCMKYIDELLAERERERGRG